MFYFVRLKLLLITVAISSLPVLAQTMQADSSKQSGMNNLEESFFLSSNGRTIICSSAEFNESGELFVVNMSIDLYAHGTHYNHQPKATRKLLLNRKELKKLEKEVTSSGFTIVPLRLYLNEKGRAKLDIALAKGKKLYDKRENIKDRDNKRDLDRIKKNFK